MSELSPTNKGNEILFTHHFDSLTQDINTLGPEMIVEHGYEMAQGDGGIQIYNDLPARSHAQVIDASFAIVAFNAHQIRSNYDYLFELFPKAVRLLLVEASVDESTHREGLIGSNYDAVQQLYFISLKKSNDSEFNYTYVPTQAEIDEYNKIVYDSKYNWRFSSRLLDDYC